MNNKELQTAIDSLLDWLREKDNRQSCVSADVIAPALKLLTEEQIKRTKGNPNELRNNYC